MKTWTTVKRTIIGVCGAGVAFAGSCSAAEVSAIIDGVEVAAQGLDDANNDEVTFSDWVESEFD